MRWKDVIAGWRWRKYRAALSCVRLQTPTQTIFKKSVRRVTPRAPGWRVLLLFVCVSVAAFVLVMTVCKQCVLCVLR